MITALPFLLFAAALASVYFRDGWIRVVGTIGLVSATAWSLGFLTDVATGAAWAIGPVVATVLAGRGRGAGRLTFEALTRRVLTLAATLAVAIFTATKFPVGENPTLLSALPWLLAAVGAAFVVSPLDRHEHTQGLTLLIGAGGALLLAAAPVGPLTAVACGLMTMAPVVAARWPARGQVQAVLAAILLSAAAAVAAIALTTGPLARLAVQDLTLSLQGLVLPAAALLLAAGALSTPRGRPWAALLGVLSLVAVAPSLRWAALAALTAVSIEPEGRDERTAWLALLGLGLASLFAGLPSQVWSPRAQAVCLAVALIVMAIASQRLMLRSLVLPVTALAVYQDAAPLTASTLVRFQWVAAVGAALLVSRALLVRRDRPAPGEWIADHLTLGLLLLAVSARDPLGLGVLAAVLILVDLALVRAASGAAAMQSGPGGGVFALATSGWPPSVRFAAITLTVAAALQASLALGLMAAALVIGVQLAPLLPGATLPGSAPVRRTLTSWLAPALSLACGVAPALVLRMLRV